MNITFRIKIVWVVITLACLVGCTHAETESGTVAGVLTTPPFTLVEAKGYKDGGTTAFIFTDSSTNKLVFCFDCQIKSPTWGQFYLNVMHRTEAGGKVVEMQSQTEKQLFSLLRSWLDSRYPKDKQAELAKEPLGGEHHKAKIILWCFENYNRRDEMRKL